MKKSKQLALLAGGSLALAMAGFAQTTERATPRPVPTQPSSTLAERKAAAERLRKATSEEERRRILGELRQQARQLIEEQREIVRQVRERVRQTRETEATRGAARALR